MCSSLNIQWTWTRTQQVGVKLIQWTWTSTHHTGYVIPKNKFINNNYLLSPLTPSLQLGTVSAAPTLTTPAMPPFVSSAVTAAATFDKCKRVLVSYGECVCVQNGQSHIHAPCCHISCTKYTIYKTVQISNGYGREHNKPG